MIISIYMFIYFIFYIILHFRMYFIMNANIKLYTHTYSYILSDMIYIQYGIPQWFIDEFILKTYGQLFLNNDIILLADDTNLIIDVSEENLNLLTIDN